MKRALLLAVACGHPATVSAPADVDWSRPPAVAADAPLAVPPIEAFSLRDGIRVLLVENHRLPFVAVTTLHRGAGSRGDGDHPGVAALASDLLAEASAERAPGEVAFALERAGARLETGIATDYAAVRLVALSDHLAPAIALLADAVRRPRFDDADVARLRRERATELAAQRERPRAIAARVFDRVMFGAHPYAHPAQGTAASVAALGQGDVRAFWARAYTPATTTIVAAGDVTRAELERVLGAAFGDWTAPGAPPPPPPAVAPAPPVLALVDVPGAAQTTVLIGRRAPASDPIAADLANAVLGGTNGSQLDHKLRDELGATLAVSSGFWRGDWDRTWAIATTVHADATLTAVRAALALAEAARTHDAGERELATARAKLVRSTAQSFDTVAGTARALERLVAGGLPLDHYATLSARLAAVTPAAARAAAAPAWQDLSIVLVGDVSAIGDVRVLGLPVVRYDLDGRELP